MAKRRSEHTLEFLLGFNGRVHRYAGGYWLKFEITKGKESEDRPHGLSYSFTLHGPDNRRLVGFDNAHGRPTVRADERGWHDRCGRRRCFDRRCHLQQFARLGEVLAAAAVGEQAVVPDALQARRQYMQQEAPRELG